MIAAPPLSVGAVKAMLALASPAVAVPIVGASDTVAVVLSSLSLLLHADIKAKIAMVKNILITDLSFMVVPKEFPIDV